VKETAAQHVAILARVALGVLVALIALHVVIYQRRGQRHGVPPTAQQVTSVQVHQEQHAFIWEVGTAMMSVEKNIPLEDFRSVTSTVEMMPIVKVSHSTMVLVLLQHKPAMLCNACSLLVDVIQVQNIIITIGNGIHTPQQ
jgi:hypothetical protein